MANRPKRDLVKLYISVEQETYNKIEQAALKKGCRITTYLRKLIIDALKKDK